MSVRMIIFHVPNNDELLRAFGEVTLRHEHLVHILKMTIKSLTNLTPEEALDATEFNGAGMLRGRIKKLAHKKLGDGEPYLKLCAMLTRAKRLSERRNELVHGLWAEDIDDGPGLMHVHGQLEPLPTVAQLEELSEQLKALTKEFNEARLEGFLKEALE